MAVRTFSSRDFTRDVAAAKRAAAAKTDDYYRIAGQRQPSLLAVMDGIAGGEGIEFQPPRLDVRSRPAELA